MKKQAPPRVDLSTLAPREHDTPLEPNILGYSLTSWQQLTKQQGPVLMASIDGKEHLLLCGHEADLQAWKTPDNWLYGPPASGGNFFNREMGVVHITQQDGPTHRRSRKLLLPGFGISAISRDLEAIAGTLSSGLHDLQHSSQTAPLNLHSELCFLYAKALSRSQVKANLDDKSLRMLCDFEEQFISALRLSAADQLLWHGRPSYLQLKDDAMSLFRALAEERLAGRVEDDSLQQLLNPSRPTGQTPLESAELPNLVYLLLVAGVGNIAILATCMMWALHKRPDWHALLAEELAGFTPAQMKTGLKQLPLLQATVAETERCFLPAPVVSKITSCDVDLLGYHIPADTPVLQLIGLAHFDDQQYSAPLEFQPERWLAPDVRRANAYGGGTHLCLGMGVSRVLLPLTLALLVRDHELQFTAPPANVPLTRELNYSPTTTYLGTHFRSRLNNNNLSHA